MAATVQPTAPAASDPKAPKKARKLSLLARVKRKLRKAMRGAPSAVATLYPPSPFAAWGYENAQQAVADAIESQTIDTSARSLHQINVVPGEIRFLPPRRAQDPIAVNRAFYAGDHFLNGSGWIGPHPATSDAAFNDVLTEIANIFTSQNAIREVTDRHASGVVGKPFRWSFVPRRETGDAKPTAEEQKAIDQATQIVRRWLIARKVPTLLTNAVATLLLTERASVRLVIPYGLTQRNADGTTSVSAPSIEAALAKVWPEHPEPTSATVASDDDTKLEAGVVVYEGDDTRDAADDAPSDDDDEPSDLAWLCFLNRVGDTIIRIVGEDDADAATAIEDDAPVAGDAQLKLGGRLAMFEMHRPALITPQVQQAQRALNFALTMVPRNVTTLGFGERLLLDASVPGTFEVDAQGKKTGRFLAAKLNLGAGTTNFIEGAEYETTNAQGEKVITRGHPSAVFREPVKPDAALSAKDAHYQSILGETGQRHVLIVGDATASAVSRIQARAEYLSTLLRTKPEVEALLSWLLETALAMAEAIAEQPGFYTNLLRAQVSCKLDTGPITPEERKAIEASIGVTISQDTAMLMLDVDDVDAEQSRMADDPASRAAWGKEVGAALLALTNAGATLPGAAKLLKLTAEEQKDLLTPETFAALPGGVRLGQPKPGEPGEVIEGQPALQEPPGVKNPAPPGPDAGTKPGSTGGSAPGGAAGSAAGAA